MSKHTPGPWELDTREDGASGFIIRDADGEFLAHLSDTRYQDGREDPTAIANAWVMVAAPDLLDALYDMIESYQYEASSENPALLKARAAIAKATGSKG